MIGDEIKLPKCYRASDATPLPNKNSVELITSNPFLTELFRKYEVGYFLTKQQAQTILEALNKGKEEVDGVTADSYEERLERQKTINAAVRIFTGDAND